MSNKYPAIPDASPSPQSMLSTVQALTEAVRALTGQGNPDLQAANLALINAVKDHNTKTGADNKKTLQDDINETRKKFNEAIDNLYKAISDWLAGLSSVDDDIKVQLNTLSSAVADANAAIFQANVTRANAELALAGQINSLTAVLGENASQFTEFKLAQATKNESIAGQLTTISTNVGNNVTAISQETISRSNADLAIGVRIDQLQAKTGTDISAAVSTETAARTTAVDAVAQSVTTLSATVGQHTSKLTILQNASDADGIGFKVTGQIDNATGGFEFQGLRDRDGHAYFTTIFRSNVKIYGDLLVTGTVQTGSLANGAVTGGVAFGSGAGYAPTSVFCGAGGSVVLICQMTQVAFFPPNSAGTITGKVNGQLVVSSPLSRVWNGDATQFWPQCFVGVWQNTSGSDLVVSCETFVDPAFGCSVTALGFKR